MLTRLTSFITKQHEVILYRCNTIADDLSVIKVSRKTGRTLQCFNMPIAKEQQAVACKTATELLRFANSN
ncbi:MAG: hypothetical protein KGV51_06820 [Moraxellaceae bacterium]|nr:hypothetical protein [Moraxellaceae bacterium]